MKWFAAMALMGCATRVPLDVMEPAEVTVPASVQRLALVDRAPSDHSFKVLYALRESMSDGPRFEVVANEAAQAALTAAAPVVGQPVSAEQAAAICSDTSATGIVSLDTLRVGHDWSWDEREEERTEDQRILKADGHEEQVQVVKTVTVHQAFLRITADSTWSVMACDGTVLDEHTVRLRESYSGEGDTKADARINTGNLNTLRSHLMGDVGVAYRGRISPWSARVDRRLFRGGSAHIRAGRRAAVAGDWSSAYRRWKTAAKKNNGDSPRAWLNLAVYHEQKGNVKVAFKYAKRAAHKTNKPWIHRYAAELETSIEKKKRLGQQLGPETDADE